jgi:hypothetical protein
VEVIFQVHLFQHNQFQHQEILQLFQQLHQQVVVMEDIMHHNHHLLNQDQVVLVAEVLVILLDQVEQEIHLLYHHLKEIQAVLEIQIILGKQVGVEEQLQLDPTGYLLVLVLEEQEQQLQFQDLQQLMLEVEVEVEVIMAHQLLDQAGQVEEEMVNQEVHHHQVKTELLIEVVEEVVGLNGVANNRVIMEAQE